jgi:hypothetical protein
MPILAVVIDLLAGVSLALEDEARRAHPEPMRGHESMASMPPGMRPV